MSARYTPSPQAMRCAKGIASDFSPHPLPNMELAWAALIDRETHAPELKAALIKAEAALSQMLSAAVMAPASVRHFPPYKLGENMSDHALADIRTLLARLNP